MVRYIISNVLIIVRFYLMIRFVEKDSEECDIELLEVFEVDRKLIKVNVKKECYVDVNYGVFMDIFVEREIIKG